MTSVAGHLPNVNKRMNLKSFVRRMHKMAVLLGGYSHLRAGAFVVAPWGRHGVIGMYRRFKIKEIVILPKESTSLQRHLFRSEYWWVAEGCGLGTIGRRSFRLKRGHLLYVPLGALHRLECTGGRPLRVIEAQEGRILDERDVIRISDKYGRAGPRREA